MYIVHGWNLRHTQLELQKNLGVFKIKINRQSCMIVQLPGMKLNNWVCNMFIFKNIKIGNNRIINNLTEIMLYKTNLCSIIMDDGGNSYKGACE